MKPGERRCLLFGGETTVTVHGTGKGGRNQELALAFALEIEGLQGVSLLSAGTDGSDGPTDAAGALVDGSTVSAGAPARHGPAALSRATTIPTHSFSARYRVGAHSHFKTGPTGTNVMDLQIVLLEKEGNPLRADRDR